MRGHNICFHGEIRKIVFELSSVLPCIWSSVLIHVCIFGFFRTLMPLFDEDTNMLFLVGKVRQLHCILTCARVRSYLYIHFHDNKFLKEHQNVVILIMKRQ